MISVLLGVVASFLPYFAFRFVFFSSDVTAPQKIIKGLYWAAVLKFSLLALICSLALIWPKLQVVKFFLAFLLSGLIRWLYCMGNFPRK